MVTKGEYLSDKEVLDILGKNAWLPWPMGRILARKHWPVFVEGEGVYLRDIHGKVYIDGTSGALSASLGHGNKRVVDAIKNQLDKVQYVAMGHSETALRLMQKIAQVAPDDLNRVYLGVAGSDATEAATVIARQYFRVQGKPAFIIISRFLAYHGMSAGAQQITGTGDAKVGRERDFGPSVHFVYPPYCYRCAYGLTYPACDLRCARSLEDTINYLGPSLVAGLIGEPVMGFGGIIDPPDEYWPIVRDICKKYNILLIMDEVITGWGRTGKMFAFQNWDIHPDMFCLAKATSACYQPLSAVVSRDYIWENFHGEGKEDKFPFGALTFAGNPPAAAAGLAAIDEMMERKVWDNSAKVGAHLKGELLKVAKDSRIIGDVRGRGLMLGVEIVEDKESKKQAPRLAGKIEGACEDNGLTLFRGGSHNQVFFVSPPLIMTQEEADKLVDRFASAVKKVEAAK